MTDEDPFELDRALFLRWRAARAAPPPSPPDANSLAAYAEGRLEEAETEEVEAALAADPASLDAVFDARRPVVPEIPSAALIRHAQAVVDGAGPSLDCPWPQRRRVSAWLAWGAVAASLVLVSLVGFNLGVRTEQAIDPQLGHETSVDLLDQTGDGIG